MTGRATFWQVQGGSAIIELKKAADVLSPRTTREIVSERSSWRAAQRPSRQLAGDYGWHEATWGCVASATTVSRIEGGAERAGIGEVRSYQCRAKGYLRRGKTTIGGR